MSVSGCDEKLLNVSISTAEVALSDFYSVIRNPQNVHTMRCGIYDEGIDQTKMCNALRGDMVNKDISTRFANQLENFNLYD